MGVAVSLGTAVGYVKPHGALYNMAADDESISRVLIEATREIDDKLAIMGLAGSLFQEVCTSENLRFVPEAFADRKYTIDGRLCSRSMEGSVLTDPEIATKQVLDVVLNQSVSSNENTKVPVQAESICIHGDNPAAVKILKALDAALEKHGIAKKCFL